MKTLSTDLSCWTFSAAKVPLSPRGLEWSGSKERQNEIATYRKSYINSDSKE